jgi:hypothetical protein
MGLGGKRCMAWMVLSQRVMLMKIRSAWRRPIIPDTCFWILGAERNSTVRNYHGSVLRWNTILWLSWTHAL